MREKEFYCQFFSMYILLVLQNIVTLSVNLADNVMLGAYGEIALSGAATVNQIQFIFQQITVALGEGVVILASQYWGKDEKKSAGQVLAAAIRLTVVVGLVLFLTASFFSEQMVGIFTEDRAIRAEGVRYLKVIRFTYLFFALTQIMLASLRSVKVIGIAFHLSIMTFFVNCGINYLLIFGNFGFPCLGTTGAAIGTLAARIAETLVVAVYILKKKNLPFALKAYRRSSRVMTGDYLRVTAPMLVAQGLWGLNVALQTVILGHMDSAAIAANSAASTLFLMVKSAAAGASGTASVMIGTAVGKGDLELVRRLAQKLQRIFVGIGLSSGLCLYLLRIPVLSMYQLSPEAMKLANAFLIILSVVCVGMSYQMPSSSGIIRGGGNTTFVVKLDLISVWCIVIPLSCFMAFVVKASPIIVVCCLNADQIFKCVPIYLKIRSGTWIRKLTRG